MAGLLEPITHAPRTTFSISLNVPRPIVSFWKSTYRYSAFTDQFGDMANSTPPPAAQPNGGGYGKFHILKSSADSAVKQKPVPCDAHAATRRSEPSA